MTGDLEITEESELIMELSRDTEKNKPKTVETISVSGAKEAEEEKIQICEMSTVSLISAGPQTTKDKETSDGFTFQCLRCREKSEYRQLRGL